MKVILLFLAVLGLSSASSIFHEHRQDVHHISRRDLESLLQQFIQFIPFSKCETVVNCYLENNDDVRQAYAFLRSDEFRILTDKVVAMPEYQDFLKYLYDAGVDIYTYQNIIRKMFGLPTIEPPTFDLETMETRESGIIQMVDDVLKVLPIEEIKKWYYNTCLPDPAYQALLVKLNSQEFRDLTVRVLATQEYQDMMSILKDQGIDVDAIEKAIADFFGGSTRALRTLDDLLQEFADFIPFDECEKIVEKYIANDPDVKQAYAFLLSDEFKKLTDKVTSMPEYQSFLKYLYDAGLNIYEYQTIIRRMLGLPPIQPPRKLYGRSITRESGIVKMVVEIMGVLPIDEMRNWFQNTCLPDPSFQELLKKISSPEFQKLVEDVVNLPEYKELTDVLRSQGIDVDAIEKAIEGFFNNHRSVERTPRTLKSLLDEFITFIPTDTVLNILLTYIQTDPDVQEVFQYLQGESFRNLVVKLEGVTELKDFLNWLVSKNIQAYDYINEVLDILGIPKIKPSKFPRFRNPMEPRSGLTNMINEIISALPVNDIVAWYTSTCEPDPEFQDLLAHLRSDSFKVVVHTVEQDPAFPEMVSGLQKLDVDTDEIGSFLHNFFGW